MDQSGQLRRVFTQLDEPHLLQTLESLDTVRALHQTVVALRKALENSQQEIEKLKKQITVQHEIGDGKSIFQENLDKNNSSAKKVSFSDKVDENIKINTKFTDNLEKCDQTKKYDKPEISVTTYPVTKSCSGGTTATGMTSANKIGVKIRVSSNINVDDANETSSSSDIDSARSSNDSKETQHGPKKSETEIQNLQINIIPEETESNQINDAANDGDKTPAANENNELLDQLHPKTESTSSNLHLDVDNISVNSMSEGDNSVFTEGVVTPVDPTKHPKSRSQQHESTTSEQQEEVDDIELIFSSDDTKDVLQEDLVSISDYEPWQAEGESGTPVLIKYSPLPSDHALNEKLPQKLEGVEQHSDMRAKKMLKDRKQKSDRSESSEETSLDKINQSIDNATKSSSLEKGYSTHEDDDDDEDEENNENFGPRDERFDKFDPITPTKMGQKWKNFNVLIETDISKCGILEENIIDMSRRNTCPNPPAYRPIIHPTASQIKQHQQQQQQQATRSPLAVKFSRSPRSQFPKQNPRPVLVDKNQQYGPKRSSSAQTEISALPDYWRSESHLAGGCYDGIYTLPSKFVPPLLPSFRKFPLRPSDKTQEARRVLLSDINFTSMVPELSRSADHLCHEEEEEDDQHHSNENKNTGGGYYKGKLLKTPESFSGVTPSASMTSPGVSQWTVNDNSYGTQTTQTEYWGNNRGDSFDSCKSYSMGSKYSSSLSKHQRSRSVPSVRCAICKQTHFHSGMRTSESMHYTPRVTFQEPTKSAIRGSLPDLRHDCTCPRRYGGPSLYKIHGDSEGSTDSLLDEADDFMKRSVDGVIFEMNSSLSASVSAMQKRTANRRCSENDIQRDYIPSKQSLPFLPKSSKCLKQGHLAKVISKNGRVVIGRVRYIGPIIAQNNNLGHEDEIHIGLQLPNKFGDCDGSIEGRKYFDCEPLQGIFVPFKKIVMAWTS